MKTLEWLKKYSKINGECWEWQHAHTRRGYGRFGKKSEYVHRIAYAAVHGKIPELKDGVRAVVMHTCNNHSCCNPDHLVLGTDAENMAEMRNRK